MLARFISGCIADAHKTYSNQFREMLEEYHREWSITLLSLKVLKLTVVEQIALNDILIAIKFLESFGLVLQLSMTFKIFWNIFAILYGHE